MLQIRQRVHAKRKAVLRSEVHLKLLHESNGLWKQVEGVYEGNSDFASFQVVQLGQQV